MKRLKTMYADSFRELKDLRNLVTVAMLLALAVILGFYRLQLTEYVRIGFDNVAKELGGMLFGPGVGAIMGALADILAYIVKPTGAYFPGFTISGAVAGIIYGTVLYKKPLSIGRVILANVLVTLIVNLGLNTYWLTMMYGNSFMALLPARIIKQFIMVPIDVAIYYAVAKILVRAKIFGGLKTTF